MDLKYLIIQNYQFRVFEYYMEVSTYDIQYCLESKSNKIRNPLRLDKHPSLGFIKYRNKEGYNILYAKDFGDNYYEGDCFKIAGKRLNLDCSKSGHFSIILSDIVNNIILNKNSPLNISYDTSKTIQKTSIISTYLSFFYMDFDRQFKQYWERLLYTDYKITLEKNNVYQPLTVSLNGILVYTKSKELAILYILGNIRGNYIFKLYLPFSNKTKKFKTNNCFIIEAIHELKGNDILILSKSRKDCLVLRSALSYLSIKNIDVISVNCESVKFNDGEILEYIKSKYNTIFSLFDYDIVGLSYSFYNYIINDIIPIVIKSENNLDYDRFKYILTDIYYTCGIEYKLEEFINIIKDYTINVNILNYKGKDISDLVYYSKSLGLNLIEEIINFIYEKSSIK
jgi:hypothetical protein